MGWVSLHMGLWHIPCRADSPNLWAWEAHVHHATNLQTSPVLCGSNLLALVSLLTHLMWQLKEVPNASPGGVSECHSFLPLCPHFGGSLLWHSIRRQYLLRKTKHLLSTCHQTLILYPLPSARENPTRPALPFSISSSFFSRVSLGHWFHCPLCRAEPFP